MDSRAKSDRRPIGVFDSGIGGLTVVKDIIKCLPNENIIYFGDTARVPYGTKSKETIIKFSIQNTLFLLKFDVKLIVVACNTSSSTALLFLKRLFKVPIIGVVEPGAKEAASVTKNGRIGVIGTSTTIISKSYETALKIVNPRLKVFSKSCPLFVPLVEENWQDTEIAVKAAKEYLGPLKKYNIDTLILGCTHYPLLKPVIRRLMGRNVRLVDSANQTASDVKGILAANDLNNSGFNRHPKHRFFVSDEPKRFALLGQRFLGRSLDSVERVKDIV